MRVVNSFRPRQRVAWIVFVVAACIALCAFPALSQQQSSAPGKSVNLININTADATQLQALPGIGPAIAERIVQYRQAHGPFKNTEDIKQVQGIGDKRYEAIKDLITTE
ncbi:ComEA family DNA-binding protein [Desulfosoma caldarium]|uniref:ComEA family DNA-binding protein n=1 Tax=Desulfosoma caldarium TaxID=610254 RepID=UPI000F480439|nr:ComEA family DNA-binding protein [Desulfosoma caldarium]